MSRAGRGLGGMLRVAGLDDDRLTLHELAELAIRVHLMVSRELARSDSCLW